VLTVSFAPLFTFNLLFCTHSALLYVYSFL
jgi:hypothetical protein